MGIILKKKKRYSKLLTVYFTGSEGIQLEGFSTKRTEDLSQYPHRLLVPPPGHYAFCSASRHPPGNSALFVQVERPPVME